jgi:hypothetical protein
MKYGTRKAKASRSQYSTHLLLYACGHTPVLYGAHGFPWLCSTRSSLGIPSQRDFSIFFGSSWWGPYRSAGIVLSVHFEDKLYHTVDRTWHESGFISSPIWNCYCLHTPEAPAGAKEHAASYSNYDRNRFHIWDRNLATMFWSLLPAVFCHQENERVDRFGNLVADCLAM